MKHLSRTDLDQILARTPSVRNVFCDYSHMCEYVFEIFGFNCPKGKALVEVEIAGEITEIGLQEFAEKSFDYFWRAAKFSQHCLIRWEERRAEPYYKELAADQLAASFVACNRVIDRNTDEKLDKYRRRAFHIWNEDAQIMFVLTSDLMAVDTCYRRMGKDEEIARLIALGQAETAEKVLRLREERAAEKLARQREKEENCLKAENEQFEAEVRKAALSRGRKTNMLNVKMDAQIDVADAELFKIENGGGIKLRRKIQFIAHAAAVKDYKEEDLLEHFKYKMPAKYLERLVSMFKYHSETRAGLIALAEVCA